MNCPLCNSENTNILERISDVIVCSDCTLQYVDDRKYDKQYYENFYEKFRSKNSELDRLRQVQYDIDAKHLQKFVQKGNILDVGCSTGEFLASLEGNSDFRLYGIDLDESAISMAKQKHGNKIKFSNFNLPDYKPDVQFDCIIFRGSFQYLGSELKLNMQKISKICKKNAKIIIYMLPNSDSFLYFFLGDKWHLYNKIEHKLIFNRKSIQKLCEIFNYKILELSYPYLETVYSNPKKDYENLIKLLKNEHTKSFPFWGNVMQIVLEKCLDYE